MIFEKPIRIAVVQLPYFEKGVDECDTGFDKWIYILRNMDKLDTLPFAEYRDRIFERLEKMTEYTAMTAEEQAQYDSDLKFARDYEETMLYRYDQGFAQGEATGLSLSELQMRLTEM